MNCPACGTTVNHSAEIEYANTLFPNESAFNELKIIGCKSCDFSFVSNPPLPQELNAFYNNAYRSISSPYFIDFLSENPRKFDARSLSQVSLASNLTDFQKGDTFLDLGPGKGNSFRSAQQLLPNPSLVSIEYSQDAINFYNRNFGIDHFENLIDFQKSGRRAKIILMSHSLEHFSFYDLPELLTTIKSCLAPGGVGIIEVPHANLLSDRDLLENDSPHLLFFSKLSLKLLLQKYGFEIVAEGMVGSSIEKFRLTQSIEMSTAQKLRKLLSRGFRKLARHLDVDEWAFEILNPKDFLINFGRNPQAGCIRLAIKA
jgi:SAM-dependent methyltransferase